MAKTRRAKSSTDLESQTLKLNQEDSKAFVNAILNPPKPNQALKTACLRYQKIIYYNGTDN